MAGSYNHVVKEDGNLRSNEAVADSLENGGDVFEAVEEMYGMIWYLAAGTHTDHATPEYMKMLVKDACLHYKDGLEIAKEVNKT